MSKHHKIDYVEWCVNDVPETKAFYQKIFGWEFTDWGDKYADTQSGGLAAGFHTYEPKRPPMVIFYSENLEQSLETLKAAGVTITFDITAFPGGRRFHFLDPSGNELAIWSDK